MKVVISPKMDAVSASARRGPGSDFRGSGKLVCRLTTRSGSVRSELPTDHTASLAKSWSLSDLYLAIAGRRRENDSGGGHLVADEEGPEELERVASSPRVDHERHFLENEPLSRNYLRNPAFGVENLKQRRLS